MKFCLLFLVILVFSCSPPNNKKAEFRIPAEWEEHEAVWIGWDVYGENKATTLTEIIRELQNKVKVKIPFTNDSLKNAAYLFLDSLDVDTTSIEAYIMKGSDEWARDYGAVFAIDTNKQSAVIDFRWNQYGSTDWGLKRYPEWYENRYDSMKTVRENSDISRVDSLMGVATGSRNYKIDIKLEGGSFEYNGNGVVIQCEAVTLQRNPEKSKEELASEFKRFGIEKIIWLPYGVIEDAHISMLINDQYMVGGTGGHTDEFVRFANENTILLAWINEDEIDEHPLNHINYERMVKNYEILKNATDLNGNPFNIIKMPIPRPIETPLTIVETWSPSNWDNRQIDIESLEKGHTLEIGDTIQGVAAAGYLNFLVTNGLVLTASYGKYGSKDKDTEAKKILE
ncbi:MAG: agmatine deiminase family protein [Bacteroidota bacterium]